MDKEAIVVDEMECGPNGASETYQVENFKYHVFSSTTSSIPPMLGAEKRSGGYLKNPRLLVRRLIDRVRNVPIKSGAVQTWKYCSRWHIYIIGLVIFLLLLFLILIGIQWTKLRHEQWLHSHQCLHSQCLSAAGRLHSQLNQSYHPCENFYQYACGSHFQPHHPDNVPDSPSAQRDGQAYGPRLDSTVMTQLNEQRGRELLRVHRPTIDRVTEINIHAIISGLKHIYRRSHWSSNSAKVKIAQWFRSCSSRVIRNYFSNQEFFQKSIPLLGGLWLLDKNASNVTGAGTGNATKDWPERLFYSSAVTQKLSMPQTWSWFDAIKNLHTELHVPILMDFRISKTSAGDAMIMLIPDPNARVGSYFGERLRNYIKQMVQVFGSEAGIPYADPELVNRTKILVSDVELVRKQLNKIYSNTYERRKEITIGELNEKSTQFNWTGVLREYFNQVNNRIDERTKVLTNYPQYLKSVSPLIDELKKNYTNPVFNRIMNNYMFWTLLESYAWHLSYEFASLHYRHRHQMDSDLELDCFVITHEVFSPVLGAIYAENHLHDEAINQTKIILKYIKPAALKQLDSIEWMDSDSKKNIRERIEKLKVIIDVPEIMRNDAKLDYAYRELKMSYAYLGNLLNIVQYMRSVYNRLLSGIAEPHENEWLSSSVNVYDTKVGINIQRDELHVPIGSLQPPVFHHTLPAALNFAGIGSMVGSALAHLLGESGAYKFDGNFNVLWSQDSWKKYIKHWDCVREQLKNNTKKYFNISDSITNYISESIYRGTDQILDEATGLDIARLALEQYIKSEQRSIENTLLPGTHLPRDKLFYIAYTQTFCDKTTESQDWWRIIFYENGAPIEVKLNQILSEEPEFAKTFACPVGSPMNPQKRCSAIF